MKDVFLREDRDGEANKENMSGMDSDALGERVRNVYKEYGDCSFKF